MALTREDKNDIIEIMDSKMVEIRGIIGAVQQSIENLREIMANNHNGNSGDIEKLRQSIVDLYEERNRLQGLIAELDKRVALLEQAQTNSKEGKVNWISLSALIITALIGIAAIVVPLSKDDARDHDPPTKIERNR